MAGRILATLAEYAVLVPASMFGVLARLGLVAVSQCQWACTRQYPFRGDLETDSGCLDRSGKCRLSTCMGSRCRMCYHGHGPDMEVADIKDVSPYSRTSAIRTVTY